MYVEHNSYLVTCISTLLSVLLRHLADEHFKRISHFFTNLIASKDHLVHWFRNFGFAIRWVAGIADCPGRFLFRLLETMEASFHRLAAISGYLVDCQHCIRSCRNIGTLASVWLIRGRTLLLYYGSRDGHSRLDVDSRHGHGSIRSRSIRGHGHVDTLLGSISIAFGSDKLK